MPAPVTDRKRGKATRSGAWPHSPEAIEATRAANGRGKAPKLVAEHLTLVGDLVEDLLRDVNSLTPTSLAARLHAEHRFAVITPEEDKQLTDTGYEQTMPDGWVPGSDLWARYVESGLEPAEFAPLPDEVAREASRLSTPDGRRRYKKRAAEEAAEAAAAAELADLHSDEVDEDRRTTGDSIAATGH
jgi:hypothetical protein